MNYLEIYEDALKETGSDIDAAKAVAVAFDAEEVRLADEDANDMAVLACDGGGLA